MAKTTLVDQLERAFTVIIARARADEEFARQLHDALSPPPVQTKAGQTKTGPKKSPPKKSAPSAEKVNGAQKANLKPPKIEIPKAASKESVEEIRDRLRPLTRSQIYALIQAQKIAPSGTSKLNKHQLIEHVIRNKRSNGSKRAFEY